VAEHFGWIAVAVLLIGGCYSLMLVVVDRVRRLPLPLTAAGALACLVCTEAALMQSLSFANGITRRNVVAAHLAIAIGVLSAMRVSPREAACHLARIVRRGRSSPRLSLVPALGVAVLAAASAVRYAPNNGDSMTYHLARVAHWIQQGSVAPYPTGSIRQTLMTPGAEYVLLALQIVAESDRLGAFLQFGCFAVLVLSGPPLARLAGAPSRIAPLAAPLLGTMPMAVLQASSTQNDLVASALAIAVVAAMLPLLHPRRPTAPRSADILLAATACTAAVLVKATAVLVTVPLVALSGICLALRLRRRCAGSALVAILAGLMFSAVLIGPEFQARRASHTAQVLTGRYVYPAFGEWSERATNVIRGAVHHRPFMFDGAHLTREDLAGNPIQALVFAASLVLVLVRFRTIPLRGRVASVCLLFGWLAFHMTLRDNEYLSRLQLPLFALAPVVLAGVPAPLWRAARRRFATAAAVFLVLVTTACGLYVALRNELRPPLAPKSGPRVMDYYGKRGRVLWEPHRATHRCGARARMHSSRPVHGRGRV
jgi:hypothetical protein